MERGTLYQLRNLLNRRNVKASPKSDVNASEDFIEVIISGYILAAVMTHLGMSSITDLPDERIVSHDIWMEDDSVRYSVLMDIASHIVEEHVDLSTTYYKKTSKKQDSTVYEYSCELLSLGLLLLDSKDAVREGDGDRKVLQWKYFMLIFRATGHANYALEAHTLLSQYFVTLPPCLAEQLKWSRFVNCHGISGHNISCDLHIEHMNRQIKTAIEGLAANKSKKAIVRTGKCIGVLSMALEEFDKEAGVAPLSGKHSKKSFLHDLQIVTEELMACDTLSKSTRKVHKSFSKLTVNLIKKLKEDELKEWIQENTALLV